MKLIPTILFALGTALCWGLYGPTLALARSMAKPPEWSPFKPYVFIGVAYVVWAIIGGTMGMRAREDSFNFFGAHRNAMIFGFLAGTLGAVGALSLTSAMLISRGNALLVMPIVFGGAVSTTAIVSTMKFKQGVSPVLWVGMTLVVVGIILVAMYTPHGPPKKEGGGDDSHATAASAATETPAASKEST